MKYTLPLAFALTAGLAASAQAQTPNGTLESGKTAVVMALMGQPPAPGAPVLFPEGQGVILIGEISSAPKLVAGVREEKKMQVAIGPERIDYTLHLDDANLVDPNGRKMSLEKLASKMWVRAQGTVMNDPRRIKVTRLQVLGRNQAAYRASRFWRSGSALGFVAADPAAAARPTAKTVPPAGGAIPRLTEGTPVVVVGEITSQPKGIIDEDKMQVAVGPAKMDVTLHLKGANLYSYHGAPVKEDHLLDKMWVRAEGTVMNDPRRIKVTRLQVIGKDMPSLRQSAFFRPGFEQGYLAATAGSRQIFPETRGAVFTPGPLTIVGKVSSDTGPLEATRKIQVDAAGNTWTLHFPKDVPIFDAKGEKISVHEIAKGQWVRLHGWQTDDLRLRVARLQNIGPEEAFRTSTFYREADPMGYVELVPGTGVQFNPVRVTGVITATNEADNSFTLRDEQGVERVYFADTLLFADGLPVDVKALQMGQRVTVQGSLIVF